MSSSSRRVTRSAATARAPVSPVNSVDSAESTIDNSINNIAHESTHSASLTVRKTVSELNQLRMIAEARKRRKDDANNPSTSKELEQVSMLAMLSRDDDDDEQQSDGSGDQLTDVSDESHLDDGDVDEDWGQNEPKRSRHSTAKPRQKKAKRTRETKSQKVEEKRPPKRKVIPWRTDLLERREMAAKHLAAAHMPNILLQRERDKRTINRDNWTSDELHALYQGLLVHGTSPQLLEHIRVTRLEGKRSAGELADKMTELRELLSERYDAHRDYRKMDALKAEPYVRFHGQLRIRNWALALWETVNARKISELAYAVPLQTISKILDERVEEADESASVVITDSTLCGRASTTGSMALNWKSVWRFVAECMAQKDPTTELNPLECSVVLSLLDEMQAEASVWMTAARRRILRGHYAHIQQGVFDDFVPAGEMFLTDDGDIKPEALVGNALDPLLLDAENDVDMWLAENAPPDLIKMLNSAHMDNELSLIDLHTMDAQTLRDRYKESTLTIRDLVTANERRNLDKNVAARVERPLTAKEAELRNKFFQQAKLAGIDSTSGTAGKVLENFFHQTHIRRSNAEVVRSCIIGSSTDDTPAVVDGGPQISNQSVGSFLKNVIRTKMGKQTTGRRLKGTKTGPASSQPQ